MVLPTQARDAVKDRCSKFCSIFLLLGWSVLPGNGCMNVCKYCSAIEAGWFSTDTHVMLFDRLLVTTGAGIFGKEGPWSYLRPSSPSEDHLASDM